METSLKESLPAKNIKHDTKTLTIAFMIFINVIIRLQCEENQFVFTWPILSYQSATSLRFNINLILKVYAVNVLANLSPILKRKLTKVFLRF